MISTSPLGADVVVRTAGPSAADNVYCNGVDPTHPTDAMKEVMDRWQKKYNEEFITDALMAWDGAWVLVQAMAKAQSIDPETIAKTLESMTEQGSLMTVFGPAHMGGVKRFGTNRALIRPIPIVKIMKGKMDVVKYMLPQE